jgi:hypothetical protein
MIEGRKKLDLTLKVADRLVRLSTVVSDYDQDGAEMTVRRFNRWVKHTRELLHGNIDGDKIAEFDHLPKPGDENDTPEGINNCSKEHADFLRDLVTEIDKA